MICTHCGKQVSIVEIFMFVDGTDERGITNTEIIAHLCETCIAELFQHKLIISAASNAREWKDLIK